MGDLGDARSQEGVSHVEKKIKGFLAQVAKLPFDLLKGKICAGTGRMKGDDLLHSRKMTSSLQAIFPDEKGYRSLSGGDLLDQRGGLDQVSQLAEVDDQRSARGRGRGGPRKAFHLPVQLFGGMA